MRRLLFMAALLASSCLDGDSLYEEGGNYPANACSTAERRSIAAAATESIGGGTRDFSLLDRYAYRVRLTDFCDRSILLVIADMSDGDALNWLDDLQGWLDDRDPDADRLVIFTAWFSNADGQVPDTGDLRRFAEFIEGVRGPDAFTYTLKRSATLGDDPDADLVEVDFEIGLLRDPFRFENAAAAASVMYEASDVPDEFRRNRRPHELRTRWGVRQGPFFVVLEPDLTIRALGEDPVEDGIIEALQTLPE
ncbi:MAG: hypothetical protein AB8H79_08005 [Myxococcota bacterium]